METNMAVRSVQGLFLGFVGQSGSMWSQGFRLTAIGFGSRAAWWSYVDELPGVRPGFGRGLSGVVG